MWRRKQELRRKKEKEKRGERERLRESDSFKSCIVMFGNGAAIGPGQQIQHLLSGSKIRGELGPRLLYFVIKPRKASAGAVSEE